MALEDSLLNPTGGSTQNLMPMRSVDLKFLDVLGDQWRYSPTKALAAYYPVKLLPSLRIHDDAKAPVVIPAGTIVSIISFKGNYAADEAETGILAPGKVATTKLVDGTVAYEKIDTFYERSVSGLMTIANGGVSATDNYSDTDGSVGILSAAGASVATGQSYTRAANVPFGIVADTVYGDLRGRWNNYTFGKAAHTIFRDGTITVPYVVAYGAGADSAKVTAAVAALKAKLDPYHQYFVLGVASATAAADAAAAVATGAQVKPNEKGKFTQFVDGTDKLVQKVGTILQKRNRQPIGLDEYIDSFPGSSIQGMDTGGLPRRIYHFLTNAMAVIDAANESNKEAIKNLLKTDKAAVTSAYTGVTFSFGVIDIDLEFNR